MNKKNKLIHFLRIFVGAALTLCFLVGSASIVHGEAGDEGDISGGSCAPAGKTTWWDTCYGATWRYYDDTSDTIHIPDQGHVKGGTISGCGKYGGYYRLALEKYNPQTLQSYGVQVGLTQVHTMRSMGGKVNFNVVNGSVGWDEAYEKFEFAKANGANSGFDWNEISWFCYDKTWCNPAIEDCGPIDNPQPTPSGDAHFYAQSTVSVPEQKDSQGLVDVPKLEYQSDKEDKVARVYFSTDLPSVKVKFWHNLTYDAGNAKNYAAIDDFVDDVTTHWTTDKGNSSSAAPATGGDSGDFTRSKAKEPKSDHTVQVGEKEVTVNLNPGQTVTVCQKISYHDKNFTYKSESVTHEVPDGNNPDGTPKTKTEHWYYKWSIDSSSGTATSEACATISRPSDSDRGGPTYSSGVANGTIMYAGESSTATWGASGSSSATRRLSGYEAALYLVQEGLGYDGGVHVKGNNRYRGGGACGYYNGHIGTGNLYFCNVVDSGSLSYGATSNNHTYGNSKDLAVPDYVGSKYCGTFAHSYQYWYSYSTDYKGLSSYNDHWTHHSAMDYWRVYNSFCKVVAKKPSKSIWNGSLMTVGNVKTSVSLRHDSSDMNGGVKDNNFSPKTLYGSWSEHLDVIKKDDNKHASGSTLYHGSKRQGNSSDICRDNLNESNSTLTISNTNCNNLGHSEVNYNSAYYTKLNTYLRSRADPAINSIYDLGSVNGNTVTVSGGAGNQQPKIMSVGSLTIDKDIVYNNPNIGYSNIYELPQVIIFVDGNLNITSNVERIDAWLIVAGEIDTCTAFTNSDTSAHVNAIPTDICSHQLTFNGPVRADNIKLRRSFGANNIHSNLTGSPLPGRMATEKWAPAEIFNLRADTYLWAYAQAGRYDSSYTESYSRELPPRY